MSKILGPDGKPVMMTQDGFRYAPERGDIDLISVVWRGSQVMVLTNREMIRRIEFDDKRRISEVLRKTFEADFGVLL